MAKHTCWPSVSQVYLPVVCDLSDYVSKHGSNIIQILGKDSHEELTVTFKPFGGKKHFKNASKVEKISTLSLYSTVEIVTLLTGLHTVH